MPSPAVVTRNDVVGLIGAHWCLHIFHSTRVLSVYLNSMEVVVFRLVPIWQVPKNTNVFQAEVVPLVGVGVIRYFVIVNVLSLSPNACQLNELTSINFLRSASFVSVLSRDPTAVDDDSRSIDLYGVFLRESIFK